jgi:hypothetical protein
MDAMNPPTQADRPTDLVQLVDEVVHVLLELRAPAALPRQHGVDKGRGRLVQRAKGPRDEELRELVRCGALGLGLGEEAEEDGVEKGGRDDLQLAQAGGQHVQHLLLQVRRVVLPGVGCGGWGMGCGWGSER